MQINYGYKVSIHSHSLSLADLSRWGRQPLTVFPPGSCCPALPWSLTKAHSRITQLSFPLLGCCPGPALLCVLGHLSSRCQLLPHGRAGTTHLPPHTNLQLVWIVTTPLNSSQFIQALDLPQGTIFDRRKSIFAMHSLTCGKKQMKTRQFIIMTCLQLRVNSRFSSAFYLNTPWCQNEKLHYLPQDFASCQLLHWRKDPSIQKVHLCCQKNLHFCTETGNVSCSDHSASFASTKASKPQAGRRGHGGNISAPT